MKLFYAPGTCAVACWIALKWANADFVVVKVSPSSEEFGRINSLRTVPVLTTETGDLLTQASAILSYIAERFPTAKLGTEDNYLERAKLNEIMSFLASDVHPAFWPLFSPHRFTLNTSPQAFDDVILAAGIRIDRVMQNLNQLIDEEGYLIKGRRTIADAYAYVMVRWTKRLPKTWREYPNIVRLCARMEADQDVKEIMRLSMV